MEKNLYCLIRGGRGYISCQDLYLYKCMTLQRMLHAYHFKNPIKFQRTFLNEKRKERKENKKEKYIIWFDSR